MNKFFDYIYAPYKWLIYVPVLASTTTVLGIFAVVLGTIGLGKPADLMGVIWARVNAWATPMRVRVSGREQVDPNQSYVVVSNHQSYYDIFVLYGYLGIPFRWVMKIELRKIPFLGIACEKIGHIFIDRSTPQRAIDTINEARDRITGGVSVLFFPEGTRRGLKPMGFFKKGAFRFALDMNLPLLPVTVKNTGAIQPPKTLELHPGTAELIIHEPIPLDGYNTENMQQLMDRAREVMGAEIGLLEEKPEEKETSSSSS
jgi:1-acyl-sn-glycerol-3-phosphate acyltransferase